MRVTFNFEYMKTLSVFFLLFVSCSSEIVKENDELLESLESRLGAVEDELATVLNRNYSIQANYLLRCP